MSFNADQSSLFEPLSVTKFDDTDASFDASRIEGRGDLFTLRSFLGRDDDEASLLDSFNAEESFFDLPEDVIADLGTIPEIDDCHTFSEQAMSPAPMCKLAHSVQRLNISHDSSTTFETALDTFSDSTSTFVASRTFSASSSLNSSQEGFHISDSFAECMRKSSQSRQQLNLHVWQEQVRGGGGSLSVSANNSTKMSERKRSHSTIEESTTTTSTALPISAAATDSLEAAMPPFPKRQARPETVMCTAQFLCGSRPTLTAALEQSRQALKEYMLRARCA